MASPVSMLESIVGKIIDVPNTAYEKAFECFVASVLLHV